MEAPKCRLCQRNHWLSVACNGIAHGTLVETSREAGKERHSPASGPSRGGCTPATNTQREGRRVLKGSTGKGSPAKPTRSASTEKADPPQASKAKEGEPRSPEPTVREPGAAAGPVVKRGKRKGAAK